MKASIFAEGIRRLVLDRLKSEAEQRGEPLSQEARASAYRIGNLVYELLLTIKEAEGVQQVNMMMDKLRGADLGDDRLDDEISLVLEERLNRGAPQGNLRVSFEYLAGKGVSFEVLSLAATLSPIPGVKERYVGLEAAHFLKRPALPIDQILPQPDAFETIKDAIIALQRL